MNSKKQLIDNKYDRNTVIFDNNSICKTYVGIILKTFLTQSDLEIPSWKSWTSRSMNGGRGKMGRLMGQTHKKTL